LPCEEKTFSEFKEKFAAKSLQNTRDFIFKITPKLKYDAHYEYDKMKKRLHEANEYSRKYMKGVIRGNPATSMMEDKIERLSTRVKSEKERNNELIYSLQGQTVTSGTEVHFQQVDSE
jgi:hypothetical protein